MPLQVSSYKVVKVLALFNSICIFLDNSLYTILGKSALYLIIPPAKRSFRGVYCFQPVRHSVVGSAYFVKSTPPRAFSVSFQYLADMLQTY